MKYQCISADCHIDLSWLPHDLFVSNASQVMKERMPYVAQHGNGIMWVTKSGLMLCPAQGKGSNGAIGFHTSYVPGKEHRLDRMASTGLFADGNKDVFRPTTPQLRLQDQDRDGVQAEVLYGLRAAGNKFTDHEAAIEFYRIYNDWLSDFCGYNRQRFVGLASIASYNVDVAVAETRRVAKLGMGGLDFSVAFDMIPLWDPYWDPFWQAAAETNLAVHFHTIGAPTTPPIREGLDKSWDVVRVATRMAGFQMHLANILASLIYGGALERYPNLRVVLGESGIGWIPYVLERMDYEYEDRYKRDLPMKMKPSEYWLRQCRATFQSDFVGSKLLDDLGLENVMWGSDYPHPDGVFPDSQQYIERQFGHLPQPTQRKIICENAGRFYGLM